MNRCSTIFLQIVIVLVGMGVLALMLWFPHIEGRNANATAFEVYFNDPFLAYAYVGSSAFFVALYQSFELLGMARRNDLFSQAAVTALRTIRRCAITIIGFVAGALLWITLVEIDDDRAGGVFLGALITFGSIVAATASGMFERVLQKAADMKSESDLTV